MGAPQLHHRGSGRREGGCGRLCPRRGCFVPGGNCLFRHRPGGGFQGRLHGVQQRLRRADDPGCEGRIPCQRPGHSPRRNLRGRCLPVGHGQRRSGNVQRAALRNRYRRRERALSRRGFWGSGGNGLRRCAALCSFHSGCGRSLPHRRFQFFVENRSRRCAALCRFSGHFPVGQRHRVQGLRTGLRGRRGGRALLRRWFRFSTGNGLGKCAALRRLPRRFPVGQRYSRQRQRTALHGCRSGCSLPRRSSPFFIGRGLGPRAALRRFPGFLRHLPVGQGHSRGGKLRRGGARWLRRRNSRFLLHRGFFNRNNVFSRGGLARRLPVGQGRGRGGKLRRAGARRLRRDESR